MVLDIDMKSVDFAWYQAMCCQPWENFANTVKAGDEIEGEIRNITEFGHLSV